MSRIRRRAAYYILLIVVLIVVATVAYDFGMRAFEPGPYPPEGTEISMLHSAQIVVETFTATGYGSDSPWVSNEMNVLVMLLDLTGVGLFFLALPAILLPLFRDALAPTVPTELSEELQDHVVVCSDTSRAESLIEELDSKRIDHVFVERDRDRAISLDEGGHRVIYGDPESTRDLEAANLAKARALVADGGDRVDASIVLTAKEVTEETMIVSVVEDPAVTPYHELAGADHVLTPRQALGEGLASKLTTGVNAEIGEAGQPGEEFEIAELPVHRNSRLAGRTIAESDLRSKYGVNVIGVWFRGSFETPAPINEPVEDGAVLLLAGDGDGIERLRAAELSTTGRIGQGRAIVTGYGEVGRTVIEALEEAGVPYTTIDIRDDEGVDIVGDVTNPDVLREAEIEAASSIVLSLPDDTVTEFATLVVQDIDPTTEIIVRAEQTDGIRKAYRAGADYVLSLARVTGRSIASRIIEGEEILSVDTSVEIIQTTAPALSGKTLAEADINEQTGCTVVVVERGEAIYTDLGADFRLQEGDELIIAGTDEGTNRFVQAYT